MVGDLLEEVSAEDMPQSFMMTVVETSKRISTVARGVVQRDHA